MRISANLGFLYAELPLTERIAAAARDGFDAVEFHWPYDVAPSDLHAAIEASGIPGLALNTLRGDFEGGEFGLAALPGREPEARKHIDSAIDHAVAAGLSAVHVMAGRAEGAEAAAVFVANLLHACGRAAPLGLTILIEPINTRDVPGYFLTGTDQARRVVETVDHPAVGIMYDFYHMQIMQGDHVRRMEALGDMVRHVQIASVPDRSEPDGGELDIQWILDRVGYDGFVGAEYRPTRAPADWLGSYR